MNFVSNNTKPLSMEAILEASVDLQCEPGAILAVSDVESKGSGFFKDGRPTILFEAHVFGKYSEHRFDDTHPHISSSSWDRSLYGASGAHQYDRLLEAMELNDEAALMACSWGKYQIMGFNYKTCGYANVFQFVTAMVASEDSHLAAFCNFIENTSKAHIGLQHKDWAMFAQYYNGTGQVPYYSTKISDAYPVAVKEVQSYLGVIPDSIWGPKSERALAQYFEDKNKPPTATVVNLDPPIFVAPVEPPKLSFMDKFKSFFKR